MKSNHEAPLELMNFVKSYNDYDFCLPHLLDQSKEYEEFFRQSKKENRYIIMDNSLHELGESYDFNRLIFWLKELQPDEFIVPDVWNDQDKTIRNAKMYKGILEYNYNGLLTTVVQGKTMGNYMLCYQTLKDLGYKKIAFSYGSDVYLDFYEYKSLKPFQQKFKKLTPNIKKALGRINMIEWLLEKNIITNSDDIHLLGTASPFEFNYLKKYKFITTIDTSNPVMYGIDGNKYNKDMIVEDKPKPNINSHFFNKNLNQYKEFIEHNLKTFKKSIK